MDQHMFINYLLWILRTHVGVSKVWMRIDLRDWGISDDQCRGQTRSHIHIHIRVMHLF